MSKIVFKSMKELMVGSAACVYCLYGSKLPKPAIVYVSAKLIKEVGVNWSIFPERSSSTVSAKQSQHF